ncbi:MAG: phosphatidate cytidylyltransferase [Bacilli bacterium]|nr:phosphatidate cytidylyltransferase [Bacilli bacterium]
MENNEKKDTRRHTLQMNQISESTKKSFHTRVISAVVAMLIIVPAIIIGDWPYFAIIAFALLVGVIELIKCAKTKYSRWAYAATFVLCLAIIVWPLIGNLAINGGHFVDEGHIYSGYNRLYISVIILIISIFALFYVVMWDENFTVRDVCFIFAVGFLMAMGFQALLYLRFFPLSQEFHYATAPNQGFYNVDNTFGSMYLIVYLLIAVFGTDIGAYMFGVLFGHSKVNPRISPNKTWEGFWGGLLFSSVCSMAFAFIMAACNNPIMPFRMVKGSMSSIFDLNHWYNIVILSLLIPPFATLGDFVFSAIKRYYAIKDFGNLIPGHGGILDRLDSIIFSSLIMAIYVTIAFAIDSGTFNFLLI